MSVGGRDTAIAMTRLAAHKDTQLQEFIRLYDELPINIREDPGILEQLCLAATMHPADYFGKICGVAYRYNFDVAQFTAAVASPIVLQKAAEFAMFKEGFKDRELILKTSKVLEPSGPLVKVEQNQNTLNVGANLPQLTGKISEIIRGEIINAELIEPPKPTRSLPPPSEHVPSPGHEESDSSSQQGAEQGSDSIKPPTD